MGGCRGLPCHFFSFLAPPPQAAQKKEKELCGDTPPLSGIGFWGLFPLAAAGGIQKKEKEFFGGTPNPAKGRLPL